MRILMFDNEFPPLGGGTGVINANVLREMADMDVDVHLVTSCRSRDEFCSERFSKRIRLFKVPVDNRDIHHASNAELLRYLCRGYRCGERLAAKHSYDLSLAWAGVPAGAISYLLHRKRGLPYFVSLQGPDVPWYEHRYYWMYPFLTPLILRIWRQAGVVTASSEAHRALALKSAPRLDIGVLPNGVDLREFHPRHAEVRAPGRPIRILCSARLIRRKGQGQLIEAAKLLKARNVPPFEVHLVGTGDDEARLRRLANDLGVERDIVFAGFTPRGQMPRVTASADLFAMPSFNEGMSVALLEALASGLPVAVTDTGGTRELVRDNGVIVPWNDSLALADKLEPLLRDPALRAAMGARSLEIAMAYSWRKVAENYLDFCEQTVRNPGGTPADPNKENRP